MKKPIAKNAFYAQSGGVSAVITASACGVIETAKRHPKHIGKLFAGRDGIVVASWVYGDLGQLFRQISAGQ